MNTVAERYAAARAAMILPALPSWDGAITQHIERERPNSTYPVTVNGDRKVEGSHARRWGRKRKRLKAP